MRVSEKIEIWERAKELPYDDPASVLAACGDHQGSVKPKTHVVPWPHPTDLPALGEESSGTRTFELCSVSAPQKELEFLNNGI